MEEITKKAKEKVIKLTKQQNRVINCLQNGWVLITDSESKEVGVGCDKGEFYIGSRLFWNLIDKRLIYQDHGYGHNHHWNYILTHLGANIKTKDIQEEALTLIKK